NGIQSAITGITLHPIGPAAHANHQPTTAPRKPENGDLVIGPSGCPAAHPLIVLTVDGFTRSKASGGQTTLQTGCDPVRFFRPLEGLLRGSHGSRSAWEIPSLIGPLIGGRLVHDHLWIDLGEKLALPENTNFLFPANLTDPHGLK